MSAKIKLAAYLVLVILAAWFARGFYSSYTVVTKESAEAATNETPAVVTNAAPANTNAVASTNGATASNADTNAVSSTNAAIATKPPATPPASSESASSAPHHSLQGRMIGYLAAMVGALIGLGLLIAHDVTQIVGGAAVDALLDDRGEGMRSPEYERAEQAWADGKFLDAIQMMREFLKNNPREQYAALRIAEIYEKDLKNYLAAALEYEELLKKKLPAERWGWAAIHLCNLYSKLGQQDKALALLRRVADDYPKTAAAKKARSRLGIAEPEPEPLEEKHTAPAGDPENIEFTRHVVAEEPETEPEPPAEPEPPKSNLPPGFRPKK